MIQSTYLHWLKAHSNSAEIILRKSFTDEILQIAADHVCSLAYSSNTLNAHITGSGGGSGGGGSGGILFESNGLP